MLPASTTDIALRRDQLIILDALVTVTVLSWFYLAQSHSGIHGAHAMHAAHVHAWTLADLLHAFVMWSVMMVGMMLPSASPMILTLVSISRRQGGDTLHQRTGLFVLGYLAIWTLYSALAAVLQWAFHTAAWLSPLGASTNPYLAGGLLLVAGVFQFTPLKYACLDRCRTPMGFLMAEWRSGPRGAWIMGLRHGMNCTACCWALMALMFVLGVMNLLWMAALAVFCLVEKTIPNGKWVSQITGVVMIVGGMLFISGSLFY